MLGKIEKPLDEIQKNEINGLFKQIEKALFVPISKAMDDPRLLSYSEIEENKVATSAVKELRDFLIG